MLKGKSFFFFNALLLMALSFASSKESISPSLPVGNFRKLSEVAPLVLRDEFQVNTSSSLGVLSLSIAVLSDGNFLVSWAMIDFTIQADIKAQLFSPEGSKIGEEFTLTLTTSGNQLYPSLAATSEGFLGIFQGNSNSLSDEIYGRHFSDAENGSNETMLNSVLTGGQRFPNVSALKSNEVLLCFESESQAPDSSNSGVFSNVFTSDLSSSVGEFLVNEYTEGNQRGCKVSALEDGGFVITWESSGQDGNLGGIYAKVYRSDKTVLEPEFLVNSKTTDQQDSPALASLKNGGFVVAWLDSSSVVYAKIFDGQGVPQGSDIEVTAEDSQARTELTAVGLEDGGFVVVWQESGSNNDRNDIWLKQYDSSGQEVDTFKANASTSQDQILPVLGSFESGSLILCWVHQITSVVCRIAEPCSDANCSVCSSGTCTDCQEGYYSTSTSCGKCHDTCVTCSGSSENQCLTCPNSVIPFNGACQCKDNEAVLWQNPLMCGECTDNCASCECADCSTEPATKSSPVNCTRCEDGYYLEANECKKCKEDCRTCLNSSSCLTCNSTFVVQFGDCVCDENSVYNSTTNRCESQYMTYSVSTHGDLFYVNFSEPLSATFEPIEPHFYPSGESAELEETVISMSEYQFSLPDSVPDGTAAIQFEIGNIQSSSGAILEEENHSVNIPYNTQLTYQNIPTEESVDETRIFEDSEDSGALYMCAIWLFFTVIIALFTGWGTAVYCCVNTCLVIYYTPLFNTGMDTATQDLCKGFFLDFIPNFGKLVQLEEGDYPKTASYIHNYGIESNSLMINTGKVLTVFLACLLVYGILNVLYLVFNKKEWIWEILGQNRSSFFIRAWILMYTPLMFSSLVSVNSFEDISSVEQGASIFILFVGILTPFLVFFLLKIRDKFDQETFALYAEFKEENNVLGILFYNLFFIQKLFFVFGLFYLSDLPLLELIINMCLSAIMLVYLFRIRPYKDIFNALIVCSTEIAIFCFYLITALYLLDLSDDSKDAMGYSFFGIVLVLILFSNGIAVSSIIQKYTKKQRLSIKAPSVHDEKGELFIIYENPYNPSEEEVDEPEGKEKDGLCEPTFRVPDIISP